MHGPVNVKFSVVVDLHQFWPGTFVSTIVHPLHPLVQTFAFSVLFFYFLNLFKLFQTSDTHTHTHTHTHRCTVDRIILCNSGVGHNMTGTYHWCASCKFPMKVLYSDSLHAHEADCEHFVINAWLLPEFPPKLWLVEHPCSYALNNCRCLIHLKQGNVVVFLLGDSPVSEFYIPTLRNTLSVPSSWTACEDGTECSKTSAYKIRTPGNHPSERI